MQILLFWGAKRDGISSGSGFPRRFPGSRSFARSFVRSFARCCSCKGALYSRSPLPSCLLSVSVPWMGTEKNPSAAYVYSSRSLGIMSGPVRFRSIRPGSVFPACSYSVARLTGWVDLYPLFMFLVPIPWLSTLSCVLGPSSQVKVRQGPV